MPNFGIMILPGWYSRGVHSAVDQKTVLKKIAPPLPVTHPFVVASCYIPLPQMRGTGMPHKEACRKGACCKPGDSVTSLCRGMATQARCKPSLCDSKPFVTTTKSDGDSDQADYIVTKP